MHAARLSSLPGELSRYPLFAVLHALPEKVITLALLVVVVAAGVVPAAGGIGLGLKG